jgi:LacI family transcriptional regulator
MDSPATPRKTAPTIPDVARAAGVSTATAGRALGGYGPVSDQARARVLAAAERLGYRPNSLARSMITGTTSTLGVVIGDIENPFFAGATRGIIDVARGEGFEVILANTDEDVTVERAALKVFLEKRVDGLIVAPASIHEQVHLAGLQATGTQLVLLDRELPGLEADAVIIDNHGAANDAVGRLIQAGHTRIALVTGANPTQRAGDGAIVATATSLRRIEGYRTALTAAGIDPDPRYLRVGSHQRHDAREQTRLLLALRPRPTAIVATDSILALGVLEELQAHGLQVPGQMSVVGFDDAEWTSVVHPRLSVIAQPLNELGALAARRVIARIRGDASTPKRYTLPTTFISRDSIARPRAGVRRAGVAAATDRRPPGSRSRARQARTLD